MAKWADYLIYAAHYEDEPDRKHMFQNSISFWQG